MKKILTVLFLFFLSFSTVFATNADQEITSPNDRPEVKVRQAMEDYKSSMNDLTKKERKLQKKETRKQLKQAIKDNKGSDTNTLLLVIVAILLPPLAMLIYDGGLTTRFWISLLLTLLFYLPGLIYTLVTILGGK